MLYKLYLCIFKGYYTAGKTQKKDFSTNGLNRHIENHHPVKWKEILKSREDIAGEKEKRARDAARRQEVYQVRLRTERISSLQ